jgi:hypothetical protein
MKIATAENEAIFSGLEPPPEGSRESPVGEDTVRNSTAVSKLSCTHVHASGITRSRRAVLNLSTRDETGFITRNRESDGVRISCPLFLLRTTSYPIWRQIMSLAVAIEASDGIVLAADSRATFGDPRGMTAVNDPVQKIYRLSPRTAIALVGQADKLGKLSYNAILIIAFHPLVS